MLDPEYMLRISEGAEANADYLHRYIIDRIIERMMIRVGRGDNYVFTAQDRWQIELLQDAGYLLSDIEKEISEISKKQKKEIKLAIEEAAVTSIEWDDAVYRAAGLSPTPISQSPYIIRLMQRNYEATLGEWENYTRTTANSAQQTFIKALDQAYSLAASGAISYTEAVRDAVDEVSKRGVVISYPSGKKDSIEAATLRSVRTGIGQMSGQISIARMEEMNWDIILVSAHIGARNIGDIPENHELWQGKFYSRTGKSDKFPDFYSGTGYGTVSGLKGVNCRHSFGPGDGENNPYDRIDTEENRIAYELSQKQRMLERKIRKTKREVQGIQTSIEFCRDEKLKIELQNIYSKKSYLLQNQNKAYNEFCKKNNLKRLNDRIRIANWNRTQAAKARGAAIKHINQNQKGKQ